MWYFLKKSAASVDGAKDTLLSVDTNFQSKFILQSLTR